MNLYGITALFLMTLLLINFLGIQPHINAIFEGLADIFQFKHRGDSKMAFDIGIFLGLLIFITGIVRIIFKGKSGADDE